MSRLSLPFAAPDISALARSLADQLRGLDHEPGHVEWLNMLARSTGHRNFQQFRARTVASRPPDPTEPAVSPPEIDPIRQRRLTRLFDRDGRLLRWPPKQHQQRLALWVVWSRLPAGQDFREPEFNDLLRGLLVFEDHVLVRRWLCDLGLVNRTRDGSRYRRVEQRPPAEALALIDLLT